MTTFADVTVDDFVKGEVLETRDEPPAAPPPAPPPPPVDKEYGGGDEEPEGTPLNLDPARIYAGLLIYNQKIIYGTPQEAVTAFISGYNSDDVDGIVALWNRDAGVPEEEPTTE